MHGVLYCVCYVYVSSVYVWCEMCGVCLCVLCVVYISNLHTCASFLMCVCVYACMHV